MESNDVKRLALIYSVQAEIEGMKAENTKREAEGKFYNYVYKDFRAKTDELENLAYAHDMQLF